MLPIRKELFDGYQSRTIMNCHLKWLRCSGAAVVRFPSQTRTDLRGMWCEANSSARVRRGGPSCVLAETKQLAGLGDTVGSVRMSSLDGFGFTQRLLVFVPD